MDDLNRAFFVSRHAVPGMGRGVVNVARSRGSKDEKYKKMGSRLNIA